MRTIEETISELKVKIIETLGLLDVAPEDIADDEPRLAAMKRVLIPSMLEFRHDD